MKSRTACAVLVFIWPLALHPAANDTIRGFDSASEVRETRWEQQARAVPDPARIGEFIRHYSNQPHLAGTPQSKQTAEGILAQLRDLGLDAHIEQFESLLPTPKTRVLEMTAPTKLRLRLEEPAVAGDLNSRDAGIIPTYNAYSGDGDVTAPLVYANYGLPSDYETLAALGIDVKGKIVIVRYGASFRGTKVKVAHERGAIGCIIYSDPHDDGFFHGDVYPKGPFRPPEGVQRGSVLDLPLYPGDPLSPGFASEPGVKRLSLAEAQTMMKIPVLPISYGDAQPLLASLSGPVAPEPWRGALPITYHLGPGSTIVHINVVMDNATRPLYDVIARIPGSEFPDQWVLDGNHHDAWVHGASDPLSGAAALMETARTLATLVSSGWKPKRTILIAFWDGEEFGLIGSTEWAEKHAAELDRSLVAILNADNTGKGRFSVGGSHSLETFVQELTRDVNDPAGRPLAAALETNASHEVHIAALGSGSDYTPFLQHLGVASLDIRFASEDAGIYHSNYDDFNWYSHFSDTNFTYGRALSQVHTLAMMRLADAPLLPFEFGRFAATVRVYAEQIAAMPGRPNFTSLMAEIARLQKSAADLNTAYEGARMNLAAASPDKIAAINRLLFRSERALTADPGLPGRPWYRHLVYAPGVYTGYAAKTLPGIREAIEAGKPDEAREEAARVVKAFSNLEEQLAQATALLGQL